MNREEWREREKIYACWLCNFPNISNGQMHRLSELCGGPEGVYMADREKREKVLSPKQEESLREYTARWRPEAEYRRMREEGIRLVTITDEEYPGRLRDIPDAPYCLFVRGRLPEEKAPAVAVIGARECSEYGRYVAMRLGAVLGRGGVTVVSGMAKGIDGISQREALEVGGSSVGVLGSGVDICYPAQNKALYSQLVKTGAVISTYPIGTPALARNFPPRNRIVSGLADAVVVIEARVKSGTLITVDMALEQGREVYVVPGRVTDRLSDGCNRLIRQGAGVLLSPEDFLDEIRQLREAQREKNAGNSLRKTRRRKEEMPGSMPGGPSGEMSGNAPGETSRDTPGSPGETSGNVPGGITRGMPGKMSKTAPGDMFARPASGLPEELAEVYDALDFYPRSLDEISRKLQGRYQEREVVACLMRLCMEDFAIQVSPGHFCCRKNE